MRGVSYFQTRVPPFFFECDFDVPASNECLLPQVDPNTEKVEPRHRIIMIREKEHP